MYSGEFPYHRGQRLSIAPQLGVGLVSPPPIHVRILTSFILCRLCVTNHRCYEFMCGTNIAHPSDRISQYSSPSLGSYILSNSSFRLFPKRYIMSHLSTHSHTFSARWTVLHLLTLTIITHYNKVFLWPRLEAVQIYGYKHEYSVDRLTI